MHRHHGPGHRYGGAFRSAGEVRKGAQVAPLIGGFVRFCQARS
jgi:hypothetical protein